jgi:menaquinone-9 beta-reductase
LHERMREAVFVEESFCSVAGLRLRPQRAVGRPECCIGDALTMIPPVTGNGMSMAFESAEMAIEPLRRYSQGDISWSEARQQIATACDRAFRRRLAWARWLQSAIFFRPLHGKLGAAVLRSNAFWHFMFARTR